MKYLLSFFLFALTLTAKGQLAIISDPDGYANIREKGNLHSKTLTKIGTECIVLYDGENDNSDWKKIFYSPQNTTIYLKSHNSGNSWNRNYISGYVHTSRITPIGSLPSMKFLRGVGYVGNNDTVNISFITRQFNAKAHSIRESSDGCTNCNRKFVDEIDGKKPWGVDGTLPKKEVSMIKLSINGKHIAIPRDSYVDIYEPSLTNLKLHWDKKGNIFIYIPGNSDGAGSYDVVWVINNNKLVKRYADSID